MGPMPVLPPTSCNTEQGSMSPWGPDPASVTYSGSKCWDGSALVGTIPPNPDPLTGLAVDESASLATWLDTGPPPTIPASSWTGDQAPRSVPEGRAIAPPVSLVSGPSFPPPPVDPVPFISGHNPPTDWYPPPIMSPPSRGQPDCPSTQQEALQVTPDLGQVGFPPWVIAPGPMREVGVPYAAAQPAPHKSLPPGSPSTQAGPGPDQQSVLSTRWVHGPTLPFWSQILFTPPQEGQKTWGGPQEPLRGLLATHLNHLLVFSNNQYF